MSPRSLPSARPVALAALLLLALGGAGCPAPDDVTDEYRVLLDPGPSVVSRGDDITLHAGLYHLVGSDTIPVPNAVLVWQAGSEVQVTAWNYGYADIVGVRRGVTWVSVTAPAYGPDLGDGKDVRVADEVEIDDVSPTAVAWGGRLVLQGVRVGNPNDVTVKLNGVELLPDTLSLVGDANQVETMSYFVPRGATSGLVQLTGFGLIATDSTPITVLPQELFEPNDATPTALGLDTLQPYPADPDHGIDGHPEIRLYEPQLSYEAPGGADSITTDWFHFVAPSQRDQPWTFVYTSPAIPRRGAFGAPATLHGGVPVFDAGAFGFDFDAHRLLSRCRGTDLAFPVIGSVDSLTLSLQSLPLSGIDFVEYTSNVGTYGLTVAAGYRAPAGSDLTPDAFEDNDFCEQADANFFLDSLKIDLGAAPFQDTLTIDTPYEVDWYRFHVGTDTSVDIATAARNGFADAQLDLHLYRQSDLAPVDSTTGAGGADRQLTHALAGGQDYYLVVVNGDGTPTRYGLCIAYAGACAQLPEPVRGRERVRGR